MGLTAGSCSPDLTVLSGLPPPAWETAAPTAPPPTLPDVGCNLPSVGVEFVPLTLSSEDRTSQGQAGAAVLLTRRWPPPADCTLPVTCSMWKAGLLRFLCLKAVEGTPSGLLHCLLGRYSVPTAQNTMTLHPQSPWGARWQWGGRGLRSGEKRPGWASQLDTLRPWVQPRDCFWVRAVLCGRCPGPCRLRTSE